VRRIGRRADIATLAAGGLDHGAVATLTAGREVEMLCVIKTGLGVEAEAVVVTGGRKSEGIEAGAAIVILRGDTGVGAEAGIGIGMIGGRRGDIEGRCNIA
jgi:hypothetical protein